MTDVTVLIPTGLKHLALLGRAIDSALAQTCPVKVVVANNSGFTVNEADGIRVIDVACKEGMTGAQKAAYSRNVAMRGIDTRYTLFLDADDTLTRPCAELLVGRMNQGDVDYTYGDWYGVRKGQAELHKSFEFNRKVLLDKNLHAVTALVQTEQALKIGGFDESLPYWEDWGFWVRMVAEGYVGARVPYATFSYYLDEGENRNNGHKVAREIYLQVRQTYGKKFQELEGMACTSCGGSKTTPQMFVAEGSNSVKMEYLGKNEGSLSYRVPRTNRRYAAGNADGSRFIDADPRDVEWLTNSGLFRVVQAPSVSDAPFVEQEAKGDLLDELRNRKVEQIRDDKPSKAPPAGVTETEADSEFVVSPQGNAGGFHIPEVHSQEPTRQTRQPRKGAK